MKRIFYRIRLSLFFCLKRIKSYILKIGRLFKKRKIKKPSVNYIDDPFPVYINITNRKAKFALKIFRSEFGFFCYAYKYSADKSISFVGCRSPPINLNFKKFRLIGGNIMSYNKASAENEWRNIKEKEEADLRRLGLSEEFITELRTDDWEMFKSDRRYYERINNTETYEIQPADETPPEIRSVQDLLDNIDDQELYKTLLTVDNITLQIAVNKINGYSPHEIACILKLTDKAVYRRLDRLKEKIKKLF